MNFKEYLQEKSVDAELASVLESLMNSVELISDAVHTGDTGKAGTKNSYGEEQVALDVMSDKILVEELSKNENMGLVASEEMDKELKIGEGAYAACFDPLDGSSLMDVNLSVGTIVGVYKTETFIGVKGDDQVAALIAVYGPRTSVFVTTGDGVAHFELQDGEWGLVQDGFEVKEGKMFAPGNLRACAERDDYLELVNFWIKEQYTLRYSGGMVPDINQIFLKGMGIFSYPGYGEAPDGKLRLLFECAPMAFLMEQAGGAASYGEARIMEIVAEDLEQRTPIFIGSKAEVERCEKYLGK